MKEEVVAGRQYSFTYINIPNPMGSPRLNVLGLLLYFIYSLQSFFLF